MKKDIIGLGIESSCDETGIALIANGDTILQNEIFSQIDLHKKYGGVVPEIASRSHLEKIPHLLKSIQKHPSFSSIKYIAVTVKPGLAGSLLMGYNLALALHLVYDVPVIPIHHLEAHFYAVCLENYTQANICKYRQKIKYPSIGLLLSGGNSSLYLLKDLGRLQLLGNTYDDACGEALDKAAKILNLPYPGGPYIEKMANQYQLKNKLAPLNTYADLKNIKNNPFPTILNNASNQQYDFSFSGIKTALLYHIQKKKEPSDVSAICYYYQARLFEVVLRNLKKIFSNFSVSSLIAAGGVLANQTLVDRKSVV